MKFLKTSLLFLLMVSPSFGDYLTPEQLAFKVAGDLELDAITDELEPIRLEMLEVQGFMTDAINNGEHHKKDEMVQKIQALNTKFNANNTKRRAKEIALNAESMQRWGKKLFTGVMFVSAGIYIASNAGDVIAGEISPGEAIEEIAYSEWPELTIGSKLLFAKDYEEQEQIAGEEAMKYVDFLAEHTTVLEWWAEVISNHDYDDEEIRNAQIERGYIIQAYAEELKSSVATEPSGVEHGDNLHLKLMELVDLGLKVQKAIDTWTWLTGGDTDKDGDVDFADFLEFSGNYGNTGADWEDGDFNNDGIVGFADFLILSSNYEGDTSDLQL